MVISEESEKLETDDIQKPISLYNCETGLKKSDEDLFIMGWNYSHVNSYTAQTRIDAANELNNEFLPHSDALSWLSYKIVVKTKHYEPLIDLYDRFTGGEKYKSKLIERIIEESYLSALQVVIEGAKWILDLEENWDDSGAKKINAELFQCSTILILKYVREIYSDGKIKIQNPSINPLSNGSLDFEWDLANARFLINFRYVEGEILGFFFGDLHNKQMVIKGNVPTDQTYEHLTKWMKYLQ